MEEETKRQERKKRYENTPRARAKTHHARAQPPEGLTAMRTKHVRVRSPRRHDNASHKHQTRTSAPSLHARLEQRSRRARPETKQDPTDSPAPRGPSPGLGLGDPGDDEADAWILGGRLHLLLLGLSASLLCTRGPHNGVVLVVPLLAPQGRDGALLDVPRAPSLLVAIDLADPLEAVHNFSCCSLERIHVVELAGALGGLKSLAQARQDPFSVLTLAGGEGAEQQGVTARNSVDPLLSNEGPRRPEPCPRLPP